MTAPPMSGPLAIAPPPTAPQRPSTAALRSAGNAADSNVSVSGITIAAPAP